MIRYARLLPYAETIECSGAGRHALPSDGDTKSSANFAGPLSPSLGTMMKIRSTQRVTEHGCR